MYKVLVEESAYNRLHCSNQSGNGTGSYGPSLDRNKYVVWPIFIFHQRLFNPKDVGNENHRTIDPVFRPGLTISYTQALDRKSLITNPIQ
jgi:hypothetical protein